MSGPKITVRELQRRVEQKAFAYGISPTISLLLGEYVASLITQPYERREKEQLVPSPSR